jgi:hypothetical protein
MPIEPLLPHIILFLYENFKEVCRLKPLVGILSLEKSMVTPLITGFFKFCLSLLVNGITTVLFGLILRFASSNTSYPYESNTVRSFSDGAMQIRSIFLLGKQTTSGAVVASKGVSALYAVLPTFP